VPAGGDRFAPCLQAYRFPCATTFKASLSSSASASSFFSRAFSLSCSWRRWSSRRTACAWATPDYPDALSRSHPENRVRVGDALAANGRKIGLTDEDFAILESVRDRTPAEPPRFE